MIGWLAKKISSYSELSGYTKPDPVKNALKLDSNENFVIPRQFQSDILAAERTDVRRYPLERTKILVESLAKYLHVRPDMIGLGNGSDHILDLILGNFASRKTRVLTSDPTFGFFEDRCKLYSIPMTRVSFSSKMTLDVSEFLARSDADILYLDMPNNPTGFAFSKNRLKKLVAEFSGLIVIDEAYSEFGDYSAVSWTKKYDNLIVVRTFSKSFGLAGLRLGYLVADRTITDVFNRVIQYPYPVNSIAIEAGILALQKSDQIQQWIETIKKERKRITDDLKKYGAFEVFDSKANFVLFDAGGADKRIYTALIEQGISIKRLGRIGRHAGCLRVTVGTKEMNSKFLLAIRDLLG